MNDGSLRRAEAHRYPPPPNLAPARHRVVDGPIDSLKVLIVCTANQCRSPMAEFIIREAIAARGLHWSVSSAGVLAVDGAPMDPGAAFQLERLGFDTSSWRSRRLRAAHVRRADLTLVASLEHRSAAARLAPSRLRRIFTLREFGDLTTGFRDARAHLERPTLPDVEEFMAARRSSLHAVTVEMDLADPVGGGAPEFTRCAADVSQIARSIANNLAGQRGGADREVSA